MPRIFLAIVCVLFLALVAVSNAETIRVKTIVTSYQGFLQYPAPDEDEYTIVLWKTDPRIPGIKEGVKIILEQAVLDSIESGGQISNLQFKEVILRDGIFQLLGNKIICISLGVDDIVSIESLRLYAEEARIKIEELCLTVEGYLELGIDNKLLVYKRITGDEFTEDIKFDEKTLWLNVPQDRDYLAKIVYQKKKVQVKVGWRQPESSESVSTVSNSSEYIAGYINILVLE